MWRWIGYGALGLTSVVILATLAAFLLLSEVDLGPLVTSWATSASGRPVTVATLRVTPGRWLTIEVQGVHVANIPGGSRPEMAGLVRLSAEVEALSLLYGPIVARRLDIHGLSLFLERVADGTPNWGGASTAPEHRQREDRSWFPALLNAHIVASEITDRTSSGHELVIRLDDATIQTKGVDAPVRLDAVGAFRDVPIRLAADLHSIAVLRDAATPYGTNLELNSGDATLRFAGTMTKPLAVDGVTGTASLHASSLGPLLVIAGSKSDFNATLDLNGTLTRADTLWILANATGRLDDSVLATSTLRFMDGGRGHTDSVDLDLAFETLHLDALLAGSSTRGKTSTPLTVDRNPDPLLTTRLSARKAAYGRTEATDLTLSAATVPGQIRLDELAMTVFGARLQAAGQADSADKGEVRLSASASLTKLTVEQLSQQIGASGLPVQGSLSAQLVAESSGATLEAATRSAHVSAVVWMPAGRISLDAIEAASVDVRRLFRTPKGMIPVSCLIGILDMRGGVGTISPLRLRTANGTIAGRGTFDLHRQVLDVTIGSQSATTSNFALDVPFRISGAFRNPSVRPSTGNAALATTDLSGLPSAISQTASQNPCLSPR